MLMNLYLRSRSNYSCDSRSVSGLLIADTEQRGHFLDGVFLLVDSRLLVIFYKVQARQGFTIYALTSEMKRLID